MKIKIQCLKCNNKVEAELKKGAILTPKDLEGMAKYFGFEILSNGYLCWNCKEKQEGNNE